MKHNVESEAWRSETVPLSRSRKRRSTTRQPPLLTSEKKQKTLLVMPSKGNRRCLLQLSIVALLYEYIVRLRSPRGLDLRALSEVARLLALPRLRLYVAENEPEQYLLDRSTPRRARGGVRYRVSSHFIKTLGGSISAVSKPMI